MQLEPGDAVAARSVSPREQIGAMASLAVHLDGEQRGIPPPSMRAALISSIMSEDAVKKLQVYSTLEVGLKKYFKDMNRALRRLAREEGINLGLERKPGETDPEAELEAIIKKIGSVRIPGEKGGGAVPVASVVDDRGDAMLMVNEIVRSYESALKKAQKNLKKIRDNLEQQRAHGERAHKKLAAAKVKVAELKAHAKKIRRNKSNPVVVEEEASSEESDLDELSDDLSDASDAYSDESHDEDQLSSDLDSYEEEVALAVDPSFQVEWMDAMARLYPQIERQEDVLFGDTMVNTPMHKVFKTGLPIGPLDFDAIDNIMRMATDRADANKGWQSDPSWDTKGDPSGARKKTHYPALSQAWDILHAVAELQETEPGSVPFQMQIRNLAASLFFYDYVVTYSAKSGLGMRTLEAQLESSVKEHGIFNVMWSAKMGDAGAFGALKTFADLRKWFAGGDFRKILRAEIGLSFD
jgi:hypothetical protein